MYFAKNVANSIFPFNFVSVFSDCVAFYGDAKLLYALVFQAVIFGIAHG